MGACVHSSLWNLPRWVPCRLVSGSRLQGPRWKSPAHAIWMFSPAQGGLFHGGPSVAPTRAANCLRTQAFGLRAQSWQETHRTLRGRIVAVAIKPTALFMSETREARNIAEDVIFFPCPGAKAEQSRAAVRLEGVCFKKVVGSADHLATEPTTVLVTGSINR